MNNDKELKTWHYTALELRKDGLSSRQICDELGFPKTRKSTINDFFKRYDDKSNSKQLYDEVKDIKILYFDLETSPEQTRSFRRFKVNISETQVQRHSHLLSIAYAWGDKEVEGFSLNHYDVEHGDDLALVVEMVSQINKADIIVGFNSKKFDLKYLNTRALFHGIPPLKPVKHIDLYEQAKKQFGFPSNSMQNISTYLGLEGKLEHSGFDLWNRCCDWWKPKECNEALSEMLSYNKQDIEVTRNLHKRITGWMKQVPNVGLIKNITTGNHTLRCVKCGSDNVEHMDEITFTTQKSFDLYRCSDCRGISRINHRKDQLVGVV